MNSCVNLNIKNMRKVKEKQKKIVSQQNKIKQLKTNQLKTNQYNERRGEETRGQSFHLTLCFCSNSTSLYMFHFYMYYYSLGFTTLCLTSINFSIVI